MNKVFRFSLMKLGLITEDEQSALFANLPDLVDLHARAYRCHIVIERRGVGVDFYAIFEVLLIDPTRV